jgi:hypothetical protein
VVEGARLESVYTVTEIVKEMSEKQHQDQIKRYEKEFGRGGIAELMRPL